MDSKKVQFIRVNGDTLKTETTADEKKYRETQHIDGSSILKKKVTCTACGKSIKEKILSKDIHIHPVLDVLWCKKCEEFYSDGEFSADEDGGDKYCRWCAQGGNLYCCSYCSVAFCEKCVRRNLPSKMMKTVEDDDWRCFVCVTDPLWSLRALCEAAKRYVNSAPGPKSRKSIRVKKSYSEEDTTESEVSSKRGRKKRKNETESTEDEKYNADSEDTASLGTNKNKRKYASSSEETVARKSRRKKANDENAKPKPHPDEKYKEKFESIVEDAINESAALRKLLTKKETTWKKNYFGTDVTKLNEIIPKSKEEFTKFFSDIKTSINLIEKSYLDKFTVLENELIKHDKSDEESESSPVKESDPSPVKESEPSPVKESEPSPVKESESSPVKESESSPGKESESSPGKESESSPVKESESSPVKEAESSVIEPIVDIQDDDTADVSIVSETPAPETVEKSPRKSSIASINGTDDVSLTLFDDDNTTDANDKPAEADKSRKSIDDSLAVNVSSIIDSLNSDDENELRNQNVSVTEKDPLEIEPPKPDDAIESDAQVVISDKDDDEVTITEPKDPDETVLEEDKAKMSLLESSSDNATTDNEKDEKAKIITTDSELSGVGVLNSDQDDSNKTKQKKKKTRKELNNLKPKEAKASDEDAPATDEDKEIERLGNLKSLKKRKARNSSDSDEKVTENNSEKKIRSSSKKKKTEKASLVSYFGESGDDTDASNISFSRFNSVLENKNKAFLNGEEDLSKKMLLCSSDEEQGGDDAASDDSDEKPLKSEKSDEKKSKKHQSNGTSSTKNKDSDSSSEEFKKENKVKKESKWRQDSLLKGKLSETDTSDEERIIQRDKEKRQREAERKAARSGSSDSEDLFRSNKQSAKKKMRRKTKVASSGSEFEINDVSDSDDSVQILSDKESTPPSKNKKKKRRRIKNFGDSDDSDDDSDGGEKTPGSANKGRKNIRKMLKEDDLAEITKRTAKEEEERKRRISERQAIFNESFKIDEDINKAPDRLILDFDPETKKEIIVVHKDLVRKLKPHQAKGVKFMWDSCFESVKMAEKSPGGGCILAHCMGLGKTLQVITLVHTVMRYPQLKVNRVLVLCPLSTVLNWVAEFDMWLQDVDYGDDIDVFNLNKTSNLVIRADMLNNWFRNGGVMVMGYEMFRNLVNTNKVRKKIKEYFNESLLDPGPDLVVCDEGHMLKNEQSAISQATMKIRTKRRIVLTGTPLQNNLTEYHCMVQFVKENLLGDKKEFLNRFANPITNGQYNDSTSHDVRVMKRRAHVLHKMLDGVVQRFDYNVLTPFLPSKHEFVILVSLSDLQAKLYQHYIDTYSKNATQTSTLFKDYQIMRLIWTHPYAMKLSDDRKRLKDEKKMDNDVDSEGSLRDFVVHSDEEDSENTPNSDSDSSVVSIRSDDSAKPKSKPKGGRLTRGKKKELGLNDEDLVALDNGAPIKDDNDVWWRSMVTEEEMNDYRMGPKLVLLFAIIQQCENIGDKVLVFSQSIPSLDMIEHFLERWEEVQANDKSEKSADQYGTWEKGQDYFRLDGQTPADLRTAYCNSFNRTSNLRARLFLISTKAGGLGINLTAANRVIIFDASWNPSYDVQSIFRIYRFGQSKPCYVYRFLSQGTMEEKIYERQVTKLSISCRVVDEQQIDRHFNNADIVALYEFNRKKPSEDEIPKLPKDRLMAEILKEHKNAIVGYHEHDSLLENQVEEELTEEERKQAWEDYENEKKGVPNLQMQQQLQELNQMNLGMFPGMPTEVHFDKEKIIEALRKEHPDVNESQLQVMHSMVVEKLKTHYVKQIKLQQLQKALQMRNAMKQQVQHQQAPLNQQIPLMQHVPQNQFLQNPQNMKILEQQARERFLQAHLAASSSKK